MNVDKHYMILNKLVKGNGIVLWGATSLDEQLVSELLQEFDLGKRIYNRSVSGLTLEEAEKYLEPCVLELRPSRVILNLGEEDLKVSSDVMKMIEQYRWILYRIHVELPDCQLVVTTVPGEGEVAESFNDKLEELAREVGCTFYRVPRVSGEEAYVPAFLGAIKFSLYDSVAGYSGIASRVVFDMMMQ